MLIGFLVAAAASVLVDRCDVDDEGPTITEVLKPLNRLAYEELVYMSEDGPYIFNQHPKDVRMLVDPAIWSTSAQATLLNSTVTELATFENICDNTSASDSINCTVNDARVSFAQQVHLYNGRAPAIPDRYPLVKIKLPGASGVDVVWDPSMAQSTPWFVPFRRSLHVPSFAVPGGAAYKVRVCVTARDLSGFMKLNMRIGTRGSEQLKWKVQTCAEKADERGSCEWVDQGPFRAHEIIPQLSAQAVATLCGDTQLPDTCWLSLKGRHLVTVATTMFNARIDIHTHVDLIDIKTNTTLKHLDFQ